MGKLVLTNTLEVGVTFGPLTAAWYMCSSDDVMLVQGCWNQLRCSIITVVHSTGAVNV